MDFLISNFDNDFMKLHDGLFENFSVVSRDLITVNYHHVLTQPHLVNYRAEVFSATLPLALEAFTESFKFHIAVKLSPPGSFLSLGWCKAAITAHKNKL
jgi:hypothetical protein